MSPIVPSPLTAAFSAVKRAAGVHLLYSWLQMCWLQSYWVFFLSSKKISLQNHSVWPP